MTNSSVLVCYYRSDEPDQPIEDLMLRGAQLSALHRVFSAKLCKCDTARPLHIRRLRLSKPVAYSLPRPGPDIFQWPPHLTRRGGPGHDAQIPKGAPRS